MRRTVARSCRLRVDRLGMDMKDDALSPHHDAVRPHQLHRWGNDGGPRAAGQPCGRAVSFLLTSRCAAPDTAATARRWSKKKLAQGRMVNFLADSITSPDCTISGG